MIVFDTLSRLLAWIYTQVFGTKAAPQDSNPFAETTITAPNGIGRATTIGLGATLVELWVPDAHGGERDVVLGYDDRSLYLDDPAHPVFGATVGRVAGRISNGAFTLDGKTYKLAQNDGASCIHGGKLGWDRRVWKRVAHSKNSVTYELVDNAYEGFPGKVTARATYEILNGPELRMSVKCTTTERTPVVVSNHSYWNLDGHEPTLVKDTHDLRISASRRAEVGGLYVPTGKLVPVAGSPYDFLKPHIIGSRWEELTRDGTTLGYNDNWVYDTPRHEGAPALTLTSTKSGVRMDMFTNQPSVVLYSAIYLDGVTRKGGNGCYVPHSALAIEHQAPADAINKPEFGVNVVLNPGEEFSWWATARFSTVDSLH